MNLKRMTDIFPDFISGGFFTGMINPPWHGTINSDELDFNYITKYGQRYAGGVCMALLGHADVMPPEGTAHISRLLMARYGDKWSKVWKAMIADYNPLENYSMTEEGTDNVVRHDEQTVNTTDDMTYTGTEKDHSATGVYGFDSITAADSDTTDSSKTFENRQDNRLVIDDKKGDGTETTTHKFKRSGNIGVLTATEMLDKEVTVRNRLDFFDIVFADVNKMLTLPIY